MRREERAECPEEEEDLPEYVRVQEQAVVVDEVVVRHAHEPDDGKC